VDYRNVYINTPLDSSRFNCTAPRSVLEADYSSFATLAAAGWIRIPSTSQVQFANMNPKSFLENGDTRVFQVMLRDSSPGPAVANGTVTFSAQNDVLANRPYLKVYYYLPGKQVRGFTSFDLTTVSNGNITSATMFVYRTNVTGTGGIITPVICEGVDYGNAFNGTAYGASMLKAAGNFGVSAPGWIGINVWAAASNACNVKKMWQKDSSSNWLQVRFRPTAMDTNNLQADQQLLGSADSAKKPYLKVYYPMTYLGGPWNIVTNTAVQGTNYAIATIQIQISGTSIGAKKEVTNVTLKGSASKPIPGSTLSYRIMCSNRTMISGVQVIVIDSVMTNTAYVTNSANVPAGWTLEYSTNVSPSQTYSSGNYSTTQPASSKVRWVRWKRASWGGLAKETFRYRVTVR
jgi:uncharacterized repeat protein (TIGR01451 family)